MGQTDFHLDTREFDKALAEYAAVSQKDWTDVVNRQALNVAIHAVKRVPKATRAEIRAATQGQVWWPKLIAKTLKKKSGGPKQTRRRSKTGQRRNYERYYTQAQARAMSRRILRSRYRGISFLKSGFVHLLRDLGGSAAGKTFRGSRGRARKAVPGGKPEAWLQMWWRTRNEKSRRQVERLALRPLQDAIHYVARVDMPKYIAKKMRERARRYSAR